MLGPVPPLEKAWQFQSEGAIQENLLPVGDALIFGSKDGRVYGLDIGSGALKWTFKMGKSLKLPLIEAGGYVLASSDDNRLYALDAGTGQAKWQFSPGKEFEYWTRGPLVAGTLIYIATKDKKLNAVDQFSGELKWQYKCGGDVLDPLSGYGSIFFGCKDKCVYALDAANGTQRWVSKTDHKNLSAPMVAGERLLVCADDDLCAFDPLSGKLLWEVEKVLFYRNPPAMTSGLAFCSKGPAIVDVTSGMKVDKGTWSLNQLSTVQAINGTLYMQGSPNYTFPPHLAEFLLAYDLATLKEKWQACFDSINIAHGWVVHDDHVFIRTDDRLVVINGSKFMKRWESEQLPGGMFDVPTVPIVAFGMAFISRGKVVHAFRSSDRPEALRYIEVGEVSPSSKHVAEPLRNVDDIIWPDYCCLCCSRAEVRPDFKGSAEFMELERNVHLSGVPYCRECYEKISKAISTKKFTSAIGVDIETAIPIKYVFKNERYWAMFMEANGLR